MFVFSAGVVSTHGPNMFWQEEGILSMNPSMRRRGNLYIAAEGSPSECLLAITALRNQFYGDTAGGNTTALRQSAEAANLMLFRRCGIGVSMVSAAISDSGQLALLRAGDCYGYVYLSQDGELLRLGDRQSADQALGKRSEAHFAETTRVLRDKDILILCSGALMDSLAEEDVHSVAVLYTGEGPEVIARRLVEKASLEDNGGIATALVVMCRDNGMEIEPVLPLAAAGVGGIESRAGSLFFDANSSTVAEAKNDHPTDRPDIKQPRPRLRLPWFENAGTLPIVLVSAALLVAGLFFVRPLLFGSSVGTRSAPATAAIDTGSGNLDAPEAVWAKVDSLWKKGEAGDVSAWQEIVLSLERLQTRTPGDPQISGRLGSAMTNLAYAQRMQEATTYWGAGDTRAPTTGNWAKVVSA
ncbi:MAG: hypothetical protein Q7O66_10855, partial [Dehalococcoidia bacterium]|nr:hypothetical protein [Dehalococcoidia bacterium]